MKKITLFLMSLFCAIGIMAQTPVLSIMEVGTVPYQLSDKDAAKVFELENLTIVADVVLPTNLNQNGRRAIITAADPTQARVTSGGHTNSPYYGFGINNFNAGYFASSKDGDRFTSGTLTSGTTVRMAFVINNNNVKVYSGNEQLYSSNYPVNVNSNYYEMPNLKTLKARYPNANIYIGGGKVSTGNIDVFNGTIRSVLFFEGALTTEQISAIDYKSLYISWAEDLKNKVGRYPSDEEIEEFKVAVSDATTVAEMSNAQTALLASTNVRMPKDGKAYIIKNIQYNGSKFVLQKGETTLEYSDDVVVDNATDAQKFICRVLDAENGKYTFVNAANGKYTIYYGVSKTEPYEADAGDATGFSPSFIYNNNYESHFILTHLNRNDYKDAFSIAGQRNRTDNDGYITMVVNPNKEMNGNSGKTSNAFANNSWSSLFIFEEAEYPNTPMLNSVGTSSYLTEDLHNKAMATFSAPFATVIPEDVTAYYATAGDGFVTLHAIETEAIPANTGVILVGEENGKVTMSPATVETVATITDNALSHSAGAAIEFEEGTYVGYILTAFSGEAGFFKATAYGTSKSLAMNKAYIKAVGNSNSVEIRLSGATAVEEITEQKAESKDIFDLTGRRVNEITKAGIYIIGDKKVLVK